MNSAILPKLALAFSKFASAAALPPYSAVATNLSSACGLTVKSFKPGHSLKSILFATATTASYLEGSNATRVMVV